MHQRRQARSTLCRFPSMGREPPAVMVMSAMRGDPDAGQYGLSLLRDTGLTSGTLYPTLIRLQRAGFIDPRWEENGRRCYLLTPAGITAFAASTEGTVRTASRSGAWWLPAAAIAAIESYMALFRPAGVRLSDLAVYVGAVNGLRDGASLYAFMSADQAPFTYPPFAGLILLPLTYAATFPLQLAWTLVTVATIVGLSGLLARTATTAPHPLLAPAVAAALFLSAPVSSDLKFGQVSIGLAALVVVDVVALRNSRFHGVLVGLAAAVKLTPLIFIPMLWLARRRKAALAAASTFVACGAVSWAALPADSWLFWGTHMWHASRLGQITSVGNQSFNGALMRLGITDPARSLTVLVVAGVVAAVALRRAGHLGRNGDWLSATVVAGAASIVVSPVSWTHHQVWLVMAPLLPVRGSAWVQRAWSAAVLAVMCLPVTALGPPVWSNARMLTAIGVACLLPIQSRPVAHSNYPIHRS